MKIIKVIKSIPYITEWTIIVDDRLRGNTMQINWSKINSDIEIWIDWINANISKEETNKIFEITNI